MSQQGFLTSGVTAAREESLRPNTSSGLNSILIVIILLLDLDFLIF